ncbi:NADPH2 dehydrogenase [Mobilisporobacter senegalensis]|uniref:NADPH2 dehydrogenase n=1 Tax=Mobilisporobacter senegalensis TaxID=1329262 RepID=A0A3N1Y1R7_9FIRM|nr:NADPH dehydrogenase NamA [Mobilisporobacter senegalensis]ROR31462.1 NADPH2 dehydrogenase [Mobilisporobacter senegalensis]
MSILFSPFQLKNLTLKNRIVMPPMCMYSADNDGNPNDWHYIHYTTRAIGGAGLIILEATGVESRGRITNKDLGIWKDEQVEGLSKIVKACHQYGTKVGIQLGHAGRKSEVKEEHCIAPSSIPFNSEYRLPIEMNKDDIQTVSLAFKEAARRADQAGFDVVEIHAAHGYLISEFLSPLTNTRTDEYGGSIVNRYRFLKDILQEVTTVWPKEKPIIVRVSAEDYAEGGNHDTDLARIMKAIKRQGIDLVNVSSGGVVDVPVKAYPGYQTTFAETIRREAKLPVITGGLISSSSMAEEILRNERADLVFIGRELLRNPYWPLHAGKEVREEIDWPAQYNRAK